MVSITSPCFWGRGFESCVIATCYSTDSRDNSVRYVGMKCVRTKDYRVGYLLTLWLVIAETEWSHLIEGRKEEIRPFLRFVCYFKDCVLIECFVLVFCSRVAILTLSICSFLYTPWFFFDIFLSALYVFRHIHFKSCRFPSSYIICLFLFSFIIVLVSSSSFDTFRFQYSYLHCNSNVVTES